MYTSEKLPVRTHKMTDLSGITVTPGILPPQLLESLHNALERIGGKVVEGVRIDTTHFVTTEGRGREWERAGEMNIPIVRPEWVEGCEREGRIVGVRGYYLGADPRLRSVGQSVGVRPQVGRGGSQQGLPTRGREQEEARQPQTPRGEGLKPVDGEGGRPESSGDDRAPPPLPAKDTPLVGEGEGRAVDEGYEKAGEEEGEDGGAVSPLEEEEEEEGVGDEKAVEKEEKPEEKEEKPEGEGESGNFSEVQL